MTKRNELLKGLADIFEIPVVAEDWVLDPWDSLNVMQVVVLIDEVYGRVVHGRALANCVTAADILKIAEAA